VIGRITSEKITDEQIYQLRAMAEDAGDAEMKETCDAAISDPPGALAGPRATCAHAYGVVFILPDD
jgi:hypothetical protein